MSSLAAHRVDRTPASQLVLPDEILEEIVLLNGAEDLASAYAACMTFICVIVIAPLQEAKKASSEASRSPDFLARKAKKAGATASTRSLASTIFSVTSSSSYPPDLLIQVVIIIDGIQLQPFSFQRIVPGLYTIYQGHCGVVQYFTAMSRTMLLPEKPFTKAGLSWRALWAYTAQDSVLKKLAQKFGICMQGWCR